MRMPRLLTTACLLGIQLPAVAQQATSCITKPFRIEGFSLAPAVAHGTVLSVLTGPRCPLAQHVRRGALVIFSTGRANQSFAKFIKGVGGDRLVLELLPNGLVQARLNGATLTNTGGLPYAWDVSQANMIAIYINRTGRIPPNALLVLGEDPTGTLDSTQFGLIARDDVKGVAIGWRDAHGPSFTASK